MNPEDKVNNEEELRKMPTMNIESNIKNVDADFDNRRDKNIEQSRTILGDKLDDNYSVEEFDSPRKSERKSNLNKTKSNKENSYSEVSENEIDVRNTKKTYKTKVQPEFRL